MIGLSPLVTTQPSLLQQTLVQSSRATGFCAGLRRPSQASAAAAGVPNIAAHGISHSGAGQIKASEAGAWGKIAIAVGVVALLAAGKNDWTRSTGLVVRGYYSSIDGSPQPYGLEIPETLDLSKPVPLLVWLHGRGDKITDMHFLQRCRTKSQAMGGFVKDQQEAIILHPFGRQCVGWKHAGEIDIFGEPSEVLIRG